MRQSAAWGLYVVSGTSAHQTCIALSLLLGGGMCAQGLVTPEQLTGFIFYVQLVTSSSLAVCDQYGAIMEVRAGWVGGGMGWGLGGQGLMGHDAVDGFLNDGGSLGSSNPNTCPPSCESRESPRLLLPQTDRNRHQPAPTNSNRHPTDTQPTPNRTPTQAVGASERVLEHLADPPAPQIAPGEVPAAGFSGRVELRDVGFRWGRRFFVRGVFGVTRRVRGVSGGEEVCQEYQRVSF